MADTNPEYVLINPYGEPVLIGFEADIVDFLVDEADFQGGYADLLNYEAIQLTKSHFVVEVNQPKVTIKLTKTSNKK